TALLVPTTGVEQDRRRDADIRRNLDQILASPEFETEMPLPSAKESIWGWIVRKLGEHLESVTHLGAAAPRVFGTILTACGSGDYQGQLRAHESEGSAFTALTRIYEPALFGRVPTSGAEYAETLQLARALAQEVAS